VFHGSTIRQTADARQCPQPGRDRQRSLWGNSRPVTGGMAGTELIIERLCRCCLAITAFRSRFESSERRNITQAPHWMRGLSLSECRSLLLQCPNLDAFRAGTMTMPSLRLLLVDDDDIVREVLEISLARQDRLKIVGSVATGEEAILAADRLRPDLIILDLGLPGLSGMDTMRSIIKSLPQVRIVVLSATQSPDQIQQAFDAGATGYVFKQSSGIDLLEAVQAVIAGHRYASPVVRRNLPSAGGADGVIIASAT
jgi:CheY-like chemotaxis protein